jgi:carbon monoxide dehydrogenase subunit G
MYDFLSDLRNLASLMPPQVSSWQASADECVFTVKGIGPLAIIITERKPNQQITYSNKGETPVAFSLHCLIHPSDKPNTCCLNMVLDAELNPMMKMMAEKPLKDLLDWMVDYFSLIIQNR